MSLQRRILALVILVSVAVTGALAGVVIVSAHTRERELEIWRRQQEAEAEQGFREQFDKDIASLGTVKPGEEQPGLSRLMHLGNDYLDYAFCLWRQRGSVPDDVAMYPLGKRHPPRDFEERRARDQILSVIARGPAAHRTINRDGKWLVAPIFYDVEEGGSTRKELWGGGYFRLKTARLPQLPEGLSISWLVVLTSAGMLLLVVGLYWALHATVLRPVTALSVGADRVAHGVYSEPVPLSGRGDEVDQLVRAFNAMMASVGDYSKNLEQRVQEATGKADAARKHLVVAQRLAATGTLASGIAHEINNPLGGLLNAALSLRKKSQGDPKTTQYLDLIIEGLGRIRDIVQKVLAFSPRRTETRVVSVRSVIDSAHALMAHKLKRLNGRFELHGDDAPVLGEPGELQQVFLNLFLNAADAMEGVPAAQLDVAIVRQPDRVRIDVSDNGAGMSLDEMERAFDLFFTTKGGGEGSGLGLSIAHRIISDHGGEIAVESERGRGTTFRVSLPLASENHDGGVTSVAGRGR